MKEISINKRVLWRYVNQRIGRIIHHYHVFSVITILFEEMISDLISGKIIKIHNLGSFTLRKMKPRRYFDVRFQKVMESEGNSVLRLKLAQSVHKKLVKHVKLDKTLKDD